MYVCVTGGRGAGEPAGEEQLPPNGVRPLLATTIRPTRPPTIGQNQRPASPFHLYCSVSSVYHDENSLWFKEMRSISMLANICRGGRRDGLHSDSCVQLSHQSVQCGSEWKPAHCSVHTVNNTATAAAAAAIMGKSNVNMNLQNKVVFYTEETPSLFCCWSRFCSAK